MGYFYSPAYEIVLVFGLFLLALSAPSHFRARNTGTILYICWTALGSSLILVNKLIWHDHVRNIAPVWCDISARLQIGFSVSIGAATVVINRRLYKISKVSSVIITPGQRRRNLAIDLLIGLGVPALIMCTHVVVQGHRANIIQGLGCWATTYNVPPAYPLVFMWPCLLSLVAICYGMLSLRAFLKRRAMVEEFLNSNSSGLNVDRYFRLMCFSSAELIFAFPLGLYQLLVNAYNTPMFPWKSWADTHYQFNRFDQIPAYFFEQNSTLTLNFGITLWGIPFISYIFFVFFGLGREQLNQYKRWFYALLKPFGVTPPKPKPYNPHRRTWWQKLFRLRGASNATHYGTHGTGLTSHGATDSLPAFRHHGTPQHMVSYEKPIPSARSKNALTSISDALTFDLDEKIGIDIDIDIDSGTVITSTRPQAVVDVNKALPTSPTDVDSSSEHEHGCGGDGGDEKYHARDSQLSTSSASSVAGSSRRVSAAIRDVELSEAEMRVIEARIQRMA